MYIKLRTHLSDERLSVPAIDGAVVCRLAAGVENEVVGDVIATAEAIVEIEASAGEIIAHVVRQRRLRRLCLEPA